MSTAPRRDTAASNTPERALSAPLPVSLSLTGRKWTERPADPGPAAALARAHGLPPLVASLLARRAGARAEAWLSPSLDHLHDPREMAGLDRAIERIRRAVAQRERVRIVTDYDVDGTTSSLILQRTLGLLVQRAGGDPSKAIDYHIPHRFDEGYGFSRRAAESAAEDGVHLILTADIGVRDHAAVELAASRGVDVIVCDHHLPAGEDVPGYAFSVLCPPQRGCAYPNKALAACGVSLKVAQALLADHPKRDAVLLSLMKLAAIGTVADVVDLSTLENRAIVSLGLDALRRGPHAPGLAALLEAADLKNGEIDASDLGYRLGPRINAAGRLDTATAVIELLNETDLGRARERAREIERLNDARQHIQGRLVDTCLLRLPETPPAFVVMWGPEDEGWHRGVVGIVAAKVRDKVHRPTAIVAVSGDECRGSVRSVPGVHAVEALDAASDLLIKWGGHPVAAGFSARAEHLPALSERLAGWTALHAGAAALVPTLEIDATAAPHELDRRTLDALLRLGPHGKGNPAPVLRVDGVAERVGRLGERHLRFQVGSLDCVWWSGAEHLPALRGPVSVAGVPGLNTWQGRTTVRLTVEDVRLSPTSP